MHSFLREPPVDVTTTGYFRMWAYPILNGYLKFSLGTETGTGTGATIVYQVGSPHGEITSVTLHTLYYIYFAERHADQVTAWRGGMGLGGLRARIWQHLRCGLYAGQGNAGRAAG